ncbi:glycosyltransferase family 39 protein [Candidatus Scalindua japonica]|uniref:glycosyltransferase family 39 protein n=1 Tax=Candidatus Scalindua japonica TaxID=1284222 RepID=UPI000BDF19C9|nr:glycosyltransferase family 39 protein [Candidatus Scalindua japonica]
MFRLKQLLYFLGSISFFAWAYYCPQFHDAKGGLNGEFCLPVSVGIALIIRGCTIHRRLRKSSFWFALSIIGQAVALQLINAGPYVRYQHYKPLHSLLTGTNLFLLFFLLTQTVLVVASFRTLWPDIQTWLCRTFKFWQLLSIGLLFSLSSATVSREIFTYSLELPFATFIQLLNLATVILVVWNLPEETLIALKQVLDKILKRSGRKNDYDGIDPFAIVASVGVTLLAAVLSIISYERHPHIPDEVGYLYHAKYFAAGMLTMPAAPVPEAFNIDLMTYEDNRWYSPVSPGWPAILAIGMFFGVPWMVNPVLGGFSTLLAYIFIRTIYDRYTARIATLLLCISPWFIFMATNFMTHTLTLLCTLISAVAVVWSRKTGKVSWAWIGGLSVGMVSLTRPLEGVIVAGLLGLWAIGLGGQRLRLSAIAGFVFGAIILGSLALPYNKFLTGNPLKFPIMAYFDKYYGHMTNALGFGPERGFEWPHDPYPGHGFMDVLVNSNLNIFSINIELLGWSTGSLIFFAVMLFSRVKQRNDYLMLSAIFTVIAAHAFYWFSGGPDFGARYWYLAIVPCIALTVRGIQVLAGRLESDLSPVTHQGNRVICGGFLLCFITLINFFPWRAIDKYHLYRGMRPDIRHLAKENNFGKSLVLIRGNREPDYVSAAIYNPVDLHTDVPIYAWDKNEDIRNRLQKEYSGRSIWIVEGPSITGGGYNVVEGPMPSTKR